MLILNRVIKTFGIAACVVAMPVFAESAPVYDLDSTQSEQFESPPDQIQFSQAQPAPQEPAAAYVPGEGRAEPPIASSNVEQRMQRIEQQLSSSPTGEALARMESLQDQVQALRGQVEQLTHQLEQVQTQQKNLYADLDKRLAQSQSSSTESSTKSTSATEAVAANDKPANEVAVAVVKSTAKTAAATKITAPTIIDSLAAKTAADQPNVGEEQQFYQTAYNFIKVKKYKEAVSALQTMLKRYPTGQFASNAHYWLGELYGLMGNNDEALSEFSLVVHQYPHSPRISDAQLKVGLILASQLKWSDAKTALKSVINHYPGTASAKLASEQLKQIKQAGH